MHIRVVSFFLASSCMNDLSAKGASLPVIVVNMARVVAALSEGIIETICKRAEWNSCGALIDVVVVRTFY